MHLIGFTVKIYHDAWSRERQNLKSAVISYFAAKT